MPHYGALLKAIAIFPFEIGLLDLKGCPEFAVLPVSASEEGRALTRYAETGLAFAITQYIWVEAEWLDKSSATCEADAIAEGIGEMFVNEVRSRASSTKST
jgi:hypothetical protein